ncbi:helicase associated domain-containing protein [Streptomyces sp. SP2-10]|uniref:helicase associated domain-containing protein n=1 Tax=Streptomyces sp. SP2-10 TaxID=2873385 RepID=UPI00223ACD28|nr:helicase associated domain-containing protein [Streptomyces sp. SP2-10]
MTSPWSRHRSRSCAALKALHRRNRPTVVCGTSNKTPPTVSWRAHPTDTNPLAPARRARRTFEQTVQLLELIPAARETIRVDGDTVKLGAWLAKARTKHCARQLPEDHVRLVAALFEGDWTAEDAVPAVLA